MQLACQNFERKEIIQILLAIIFGICVYYNMITGGGLGWAWARFRLATIFDGRVCQNDIGKLEEVRTVSF
jgi:hypothetical protein